MNKFRPACAVCSDVKVIRRAPTDSDIYSNLIKLTIKTSVVSFSVKATCGMEELMGPLTLTRNV